MKRQKKWQEIFSFCLPSLYIYKILLLNDIYIVKYYCNPNHNRTFFSAFKFFELTENPHARARETNTLNYYIKLKPMFFFLFFQIM